MRSPVRAQVILTPQLALLAGQQWWQNAGNTGGAFAANPIFHCLGQQRLKGSVFSSDAADTLEVQFSPDGTNFPNTQTLVVDPANAGSYPFDFDLCYPFFRFVVTDAGGGSTVQIQAQVFEEGSGPTILGGGGGGGVASLQISYNGGNSILTAGNLPVTVTTPAASTNAALTLTLGAGSTAPSALLIEGNASAAKLIDLQTLGVSQFNVNAAGDTFVRGKLTVLGAIDPTSLSLTGTASFIDQTDGTAAAVAAAGHGRIIYNDTTKHLQFSKNGGGYAFVLTSDTQYTSGAGGITLQDNAGANVHSVQIRKITGAALTSSALFVQISPPCTGPAIFAVAGNGSALQTLDGPISMSVLAADPAAVASDGHLYTKLAAGVAQLFYESDAGVVYQLTPTGGGGGSLQASYTAGGGAIALSLVGGPLAITNPVATAQTALSVVQNTAGQFAADFTGDVRVTGKLTVTGAIDPPSLSLSGGTALFLDSTDGSTAPLSAAGHGRLRYNNGTSAWEISVNGAAYTALATSAGETLGTVLAAGNVSGANPILMTTGQELDAATPAAVLSVGTTNAGALGIGNPSGGTSAFQIFVNQGGASFSSNAGFQLSSTTANRAAARFNQFGANTGVPEFVGFKSRAATTGTLASVADGDVLARMTAIGVTGDNLNVPPAGFVSIQVPTGGTNATWVATDFSVSLVPLAGPINSNRQVFKITSEAAADFIDGTTAPVTVAAHGGLRYNNTTKTFQVSVDTGAWTSLSTGTATLQSAYAAGNTIAATAARPIAFSNAVDATDLLTLTRTFAGAGRGLFVSMGPTTTGNGIAVSMATGATGSALSILGGNVTTLAPVFTATQTWNNAGTTFAGILLNITNTASAAGSRLFSLQTGGVEKLGVDVSGNLFGRSAGAGTWTLSSLGNNGLLLQDSIRTTSLQFFNADNFTLSGPAPGAGTTNGPANCVVSAGSSLGTPGTGATLLLLGGQGGGGATDSGGALKIQTAQTGASTALVNRAIYNPVTKALTSGVAVTLLQAAVAANSAAGGFVRFTIRATDGTDWQTLTGILTFGAVNKAGAITAPAPTIVTSTPVSPVGTLTVTAAATTGASLINVQLNATSAGLGALTTFDVTYIVENNGVGNDVTIV